MSIQPANKAVEHLISSYNWYCKKKTDAVRAYLVKNSKGEGEEEGGGGGEKRWWGGWEGGGGGEERRNQS